MHVWPGPELSTAESLPGDTRTNDTDRHTENIFISIYGSGRPKKGETRLPVETRYVFIIKIVEDKAALEKRRKMAGCFVLLTHIANEEGMEYTAEKVLQIYKEQNGVGKILLFSKMTKLSMPCF